MDSKITREYNVCLARQRYVTTLMMLLIIIVTYCIRESLSVALTYMLESKSKHTNFTSHCNYSYVHTFEPITVHLYQWTKQDLRRLKHAYYSGYILTQIPSGIYSDMYGGKYPLAAALLGSSTFTLIAPGVIHLSGGSYFGLMVVRGFIGACNGLVFPAVHSLLSNWAPARERGALSSICFAATQVSIALSNLVSGRLILLTKEWHTVFYFYGGIGVVLFGIWMLFGHSYHTNNKLITKKEYLYMSRELGRSVTRGKKPIPWTQMVLSLPLWSVYIAHWGHLCMWPILIRELPNYMKQIFGFDILHGHETLVICYLVMACTTVTMGVLSDFFIVNKYMQIDTARKLFTIFGAMGPAIFTLAAAYAECDYTMVIVNFSLSLCLMSGYYTGTRVNLLDLAPNYSGTIMGLGNGLGVIPTLVTPEVIKWLKPNGTLKEWKSVFFSFMIVRGVSNLPFIIFGTGLEQAWNRKYTWGEDEDSSTSSSSSGEYK